MRYCTPLNRDLLYQEGAARWRYQHGAYLLSNEEDVTSLFRVDKLVHHFCRLPPEKIVFITASLEGLRCSPEIFHELFTSLKGLNPGTNYFPGY